MKFIDDLPKPLEVLGGGLLLAGFIILVLPIHLGVALIEYAKAAITAIVPDSRPAPSTVLISVIVVAMTISVSLQVVSQFPRKIDDGEVLCAGLFGCQPMSQPETLSAAAAAVWLFLIIRFAAVRGKNSS